MSSYYKLNLFCNCFLIHLCALCIFLFVHPLVKLAMSSFYQTFLTSRKHNRCCKVAPFSACWTLMPVTGTGPNSWGWTTMVAWPSTLTYWGSECPLWFNFDKDHCSAHHFTSDSQSISKQPWPHLRLVRKANSNCRSAEWEILRLWPRNHPLISSLGDSDAH
jgi:hypothetical protein